VRQTQIFIYIRKIEKERGRENGKTTTRNIKEEEEEEIRQK